MLKGLFTGSKKYPIGIEINAPSELYNLVRLGGAYKFH